MPVRVQLRRTKGWRLPSNTVSVARPSKWGNPFRLASNAVEWSLPDGSTGRLVFPDTESARRYVVDRMRRALRDGRLGFTVEDVVRDLRGRNLACYCGLDQSCHADVLLEVANR